MNSMSLSVLKSRGEDFSAKRSLRQKRWFSVRDIMNALLSILLLFSLLLWPGMIPSARGENSDTLTSSPKEDKRSESEGTDHLGISNKKHLEEAIRNYVSKAVRAFDFNSPSGTTFPGMTGVQGNDLYSKEIGYGWLTLVPTFDVSWEGLDLDPLNTDFAMGMGPKAKMDLENI